MKINRKNLLGSKSRQLKLDWVKCMEIIGKLVKGMRLLELNRKSIPREKRKNNIQAYKAVQPK